MTESRFLIYELIAASVLFDTDNIYIKTSYCMANQPDLIGRGGFGCAFYPGLPCVGESEARSGYVSKVMEPRFAETELKEGGFVRDFISDNPSAGQYLIIPEPTTCVPDITRDVASEYGAECPVLTGNTPPLSIWTRYGGRELQKYWAETWVPGSRPVPTFVSICRALVDLTESSLIPLGDSGIVHMDVKPENVVVGIGDRDGEIIVRLIDWGVSINMNDDGDAWDAPVVQNNLYAYAYNRCPTQILLSPESVGIINKDVPTYDDGYLVVANNLVDRALIENKGSDSLKWTIEVMSIVGIEDPIAHLKNGIAKVIQGFWDEELNEFDVQSLYAQVFVPNADLWGLGLCVLDVATAADGEGASSKCVLGSREFLRDFLWEPEYWLSRFNVSKYCDALANAGT